MIKPGHPGMYKIKLFFLVVALSIIKVDCGAQNTNVESSVIHFNGTELQSFIDSAPPYSIIICNRNDQLSISKTIMINKPLTIINLNAILADSLGKTPIIEVHSKNVNISDFHLSGNAKTVDQKVRSPLIKIHKSQFRLERGLFENGSKDGVEITPISKNEIIDGGVVRDIVGHGCVRDVISISGTQKVEGTSVKNIIVENIRGYNSSLRGVVEISDGSENITVRNVYAENCVYAVDWQDHNQKTQVNRNVVIDNIYALKCRFAVKSTVHDFGHSNLTISNVLAEKCEEPIQVTNTSNVIVQNVRIIDHFGDKNPILAQNCNGLFLQNINISNSTSGSEKILIENCDEVLINGVSIVNNTEEFSGGITYRISNDKVYENLRITNVSANTGKNAGIILVKEKGATLKNYLISGNISRVSDQIQGKNGRIINTLE